uniref:Uncharacterized protein n=1 Tax=viral metagenome TaxID=1070528 RepID=A0A6M3ILD9_9ZZZZ
MQEIISNPVNFDTFQLVCSACYSLLQVRYDRCGLSFVEECECQVQEREKMKEEIDELEGQIRDLEEDAESRQTEIEELKQAIDIVSETLNLYFSMPRAEIIEP